MLEPTQDQWAAALERCGEYHREGAELKGPCPLCGGQDRFRVLADGRAFCRQCYHSGDGQWIGRLKVAVFGQSRTRPSNGPLSRPGPTRPYRPNLTARAAADRQSASRPATNSDQARQLWKAACSVFAEQAPARFYLERRGVWPASQPLPFTLAWLPVADWPKALHWTKPPAEAAGAIVWAFEHPLSGDVLAVQLEALTAHGQPVPYGKAKRKTIGPSAEAVFRCDSLEPACLVWCEGPVDALAARRLYRPCCAWAAAGAGTLAKPPAEAIRQTGLPVRIAGDGDTAGRAAAAGALYALAAAGIEAKTESLPDGKDLADILKDERNQPNG